MNLEPNIQEALRAQARGGSTVADLIRMVRRRAEVDGPGEGRMLVSAYLTRTFAIPLDRVAEISGWVGFGDTDGQTTDDELEVLLGPYVHRA
ncbi:hypothetical protein [Enhygromyxa salina]|uniref:hypothetical protein n=1 Tax=Enhygromyxa salina TaxID=215803 RepID=UPI00069880A0|nr:hypothetical protein [Enhygromyxa salina]